MTDAVGDKPNSRGRSIKGVREKRGEVMAECTSIEETMMCIISSSYTAFRYDEGDGPGRLRYDRLMSEVLADENITFATKIKVLARVLKAEGKSDRELIRYLNKIRDIRNKLAHSKVTGRDLSRMSEGWQRLLLSPESFWKEYDKFNELYELTTRRLSVIWRAMGLPWDV